LSFGSLIDASVNVGLLPSPERMLLSVMDQSLALAIVPRSNYNGKD